MGKGKEKKEYEKIRVGKKGYFLLAFTVFFAYFVFSCGPGPFERGEEVGETESPGQAEISDEYRAVYDILQANCIGCHKTGGPAGTTKFVLSGNPSADYDTIIALVDTQNPAESLLLKKGYGEISHGGGKSLNDEDYEKIKQWIQNGAKK